MGAGEQGPSYRTGRPHARTFVLGGVARSLAASGVVLVGGLAVLAGPKLLWPIGGTATAIGLAQLFDGVPTRLVVEGDAAVLHRFLRPRATFALSATTAQQLPDELVLVTGVGTFGIEAGAFDRGDFGDCVMLLRQACRRFVEKPVLRPPG